MQRLQRARTVEPVRPVAPVFCLSWVLNCDCSIPDLIPGTFSAFVLSSVQMSPSLTEFQISMKRCIFCTKDDSGTPPAPFLDDIESI